MFDHTFSMGMRILTACMLALLVVATPVAVADCEPCTPAQRQAEYDEIVARYRAAVEQARQGGYQCAADPDYDDPGDGNHARPGNCADWAWTTWSALVTKQWACWDVMRIRARHKFAFWVYHQFVYIRPRCGGERIFLDPYTTGRPDRWREDAFPDRDGFWGGWIYYPVGRHPAGSPAITPQ